MLFIFIISTLLLFPHFIFAKIGIYGLGPCPRVKPMEDFDITKFYGKWYSIAHYSEYSRDHRCKVLEFTDGNPEDDVCRVYVSNNSTLYGSGETVRIPVYDRLIPDVTQSSVWISTFGEYKEV